MIINYLNNKYNNLKTQTSRQIRRTKELYRHYLDNPSMKVLQSSTTRRRGVYIVKYHAAKRKLVTFWDNNKVLLTPSGFYKQSVAVTKKATKKSFDFFYKNLFPDLYKKNHPPVPDPDILKKQEEQQIKLERIKLAHESYESRNLRLNYYKANPLLPLKIDFNANRRYTKEDFVDYYNHEPITTTSVGLYSLSIASKDIIKINNRLKNLSGDPVKRQLQQNSLRLKLIKDHESLTERYKHEYLLFKSRLKYIEDQENQTKIGPLLIKYEDWSNAQINEHLKDLIQKKITTVSLMVRDDAIKTSSMKNINDMQNLIEVSATDTMKDDLNEIGKTFNRARLLRIENLPNQMKKKGTRFLSETFYHFKDYSPKSKCNPDQAYNYFMNVGYVHKQWVTGLEKCTTRINRYLDTIDQTVDKSFIEYRNSIFDYEIQKIKYNIYDEKITNFIEDMKSLNDSKNEVKSLLINEGDYINHIIETKPEKLEDQTFLENLKVAQLERKKQLIKNDFNRISKQYDKLIKNVVDLHNNEFPNDDQLLAVADPDQLDLGPDANLLDVENDFAVQVPGLILPDDYDYERAVANRRGPVINEVNNNNFISSIKLYFNSIKSTIGSIIQKFKGNEIPSDTEIEPEPELIEEEEIINNNDANIDNIEIGEEDKNVLVNGNQGELTQNMHAFIERVIRENYNLTELENFCNELKTKLPRITLARFTKVENFECDAKQTALALYRAEQGIEESNMKVCQDIANKVNDGITFLEQKMANPRTLYEYDIQKKKNDEEFALPISHSVQKTKTITNHDTHTLKLANQLFHAYLTDTPRYTLNEEPNSMTLLMPIRGETFGNFVPDIIKAWNEQRFHQRVQRNQIDGIKGRLFGSCLHELADAKVCFALSTLETAKHLPANSFNNFEYNYQNLNFKTIELIENFKNGEKMSKWDRQNGEAHLFKIKGLNRAALDAKRRTFYFSEFKTRNLDYIAFELSKADSKFYKNLKKDQMFFFDLDTDGDLATFIESLTAQNISPAPSENYNIFDENLLENTPRPDFYEDPDLILERLKMQYALDLAEIQYKKSLNYFNFEQAHPNPEMQYTEHDPEYTFMMEKEAHDTYIDIENHPDEFEKELPEVIYLGGPEGPISGHLPSLEDTFKKELPEVIYLGGPEGPVESLSPRENEELETLGGSENSTPFLRLTSSYEELVDQKIAETFEAGKKSKDKSAAVNEKTNLLFSNYSNLMRNIVEKDKSNLNKIESLINTKNTINKRFNQYKKEREDIFFRISSQIKKSKTPISATSSVESEYAVKPTIENIFAKLIGTTQLPENMDAIQDFRPKTDAWKQFQLELKGISTDNTIVPKIVPIDINLSYVITHSIILEEKRALKVAQLVAQEKALAKNNIEKLFVKMKEDIKSYLLNKLVPEKNIKYYLLNKLKPKKIQSEKDIKSYLLELKKKIQSEKDIKSYLLELKKYKSEKERGQSAKSGILKALSYKDPKFSKMFLPKPQILRKEPADSFVEFNEPYVNKYKPGKWTVKNLLNYIPNSRFKQISEKLPKQPSAIEKLFSSKKDLTLLGRLIKRLTLVSVDLSTHFRISKIDYTDVGNQKDLMEKIIKSFTAMPNFYKLKLIKKLLTDDKTLLLCKDAKFMVILKLLETKQLFYKDILNQYNELTLGEKMVLIKDLTKFNRYVIDPQLLEINHNDRAISSLLKHKTLLVVKKTIKGLKIEDIKRKPFIERKSFIEKPAKYIDIKKTDKGLDFNKIISNIEIEKFNKLIQAGKSKEREINNESHFDIIKAQSYKTYNSIFFPYPESEIPKLTQIITYIRSTLSFIRVAKVDFLKVLDSLKTRPFDIKPSIYDTTTPQDVEFGPQRDASILLKRQLSELYDQLLEIRQSENSSAYFEEFKDVIDIFSEITNKIIDEITAFIRVLNFTEKTFSSIGHFYDAYHQVKNKFQIHTLIFKSFKKKFENLAENSVVTQRLLNEKKRAYKLATQHYKEMVKDKQELYPGANSQFILEIQKQQTIFIVNAINMLKWSALRKHSEFLRYKIFEDFFFDYELILLEFSDIVKRVGFELINSNFIKIGLEIKAFEFPKHVSEQVFLLNDIITKNINKYLNLDILDQRDQIEVVLNEINALLFKFENLVKKNLVPKRTIKQIFENLSGDTQLKLKYLINKLELDNKQGETLIFSFYHLRKLKSNAGEFTPEFFQRFNTFFIEQNEDYYLNNNTNVFVRDYINYVEKNNPRLISEKLHSINPLEIIEDWKKKNPLNFDLGNWSKHFMGFDFTRGSFELYPIFTPLVPNVITRVKISEMSNNILGLQFNAKSIQKQKFLLDLITNPIFDRYINLENTCYSIIKLLKYEFNRDINCLNDIKYVLSLIEIYEKYLNPASTNYIKLFDAIFFHVNNNKQISENYIFSALGDFFDHLQGYEYDLDFIFSELVEFFYCKLEQQNVNDQIDEKYIINFFDEFFLLFPEVDLHFKNQVSYTFLQYLNNNDDITLLDFFDNIPKVFKRVQAAQDNRFDFLEKIDGFIHKLLNKPDLAINKSLGDWYFVARKYLDLGSVYNDFPERIKFLINNFFDKNFMIIPSAETEYCLKRVYLLLKKYVSLTSHRTVELLEYINFKIFDDFLISPCDISRFHVSFKKLNTGMVSNFAVDFLVDDSKKNEIDTLLDLMDNFAESLETNLEKYKDKVPAFLSESLRFPVIPFYLQPSLIKIYRSNIKRILIENREDIEFWTKNSDKLFDKYLIKYFIKMFTGSEINELPKLQLQPKSTYLDEFFITAENLKDNPYYGSTTIIENKLLNIIKDAYIENYEKILENIDIFYKHVLNIFDKISNNMLVSGVKITFTSTFSFFNLIKTLIISNFFPSLRHKNFGIKSILTFIKKNLSITNLATNLNNRVKKFLRDIKSGFEFVQNLNNPPVKRFEQELSYARKSSTPIKFLVKFKDNLRRNRLFDQKPYSEKPIIPYKTLLSHKFKDNYPIHLNLPKKPRIDTQKIIYINPLPGNCNSSELINNYNSYNLGLQFLHFKSKLFDYQTFLKSDSGFLKTQLTRPLFGKPNMFLTEKMFAHFRSMLQQKKLNPNLVDLSELKINYLKIFKRLYNLITGSSLEYEDKYANMVGYFSQLDSQIYQILKIQNLDLFTHNFIRFTSHLVKPVLGKNSFNTLTIDLMSLCNAFKIIDKNPTLKSPLQRVVANVMVTINDGMSYSFEFFGTIGGLTHFTLFTENSYISFIHYLKIKTIPFRQDLIPELKKHAEFTVIRNNDQFYLIEQFLSKMKNPSRYVSLVYLVTGDKTPIQTFTKLSSYKELQNPAMRHFLQFDFGYFKLSNKPFGKFFIPEMISNINYKVHFDKSFSTSSKAISVSLGPEYFVGKSRNIIVPDQFQRFDFNFATYISVRSFLNNSFKTIEKQKQLHLNLNELLFKQLFLFKQNISFYNNKHPFLPSLSNWIMLLKNNNYMLLSANWLKTYRGHELTTKISPSLYENLDQYNIVATIYAAPNKNLTPQQPVTFNFKANYRFYMSPIDIPSPRLNNSFLTFNNLLNSLNKTSIFYPQNLNYSVRQRFEFSHLFKIYSTVKNKILSPITNFNFLKLKIQNYLSNEIKPSILLIEKAVNNFINKIIDGTHEILKCLVNLFNKLLDFLYYLIQWLINVAKSIETGVLELCKKAYNFVMQKLFGVEVEYVDQNSDITNSEEDDRFFAYILYIVRLFYLFVYKTIGVCADHLNLFLLLKIARRLNPEKKETIKVTGCHFDVITHGIDMYRPYWNSQYSTILMQYLWSKTTPAKSKPVVTTTTPSEFKIYKKGYLLNMSNNAYTPLLGTGHANTQYMAFFNLKRVQSQLSELVKLLKISILNLTNSWNKDNFYISESKLLNIAQIAILESNYWNVNIVIWYIQNKTLFCNLVTPNYFKGRKRMKFRYISATAPIYNDVENIFFNEVRTRRYTDVQSDFDIKTIIFKFKNLDELTINRYSEFDHFENLKKPLSEANLDKCIDNVETVPTFEYSMPKVVLYNRKDKETKFDVITPSISGGKRMKVKNLILESLGLDWKKFHVGTELLPSVINTTKHLQPITANLVRPLNNVEPLKLESKELKNKKLLENKDKELDSSTKKITTMAELYDAVNDFIQNDLFSWIMFHEYRDQCIRSQTDLWPGGIFSNVTSSLIQGTICAFAIFAAHFRRAPTKRGSAWLAGLKALLGFFLCSALAYAIIYYTGIDILSELLKLTRFIFGFQRVPQKVIVPFQVNATLDSYDSSVFIAPYYSTKKSNHKVVEVFKPIDQTETVETPSKELEKGSSEVVPQIFEFYNFDV